jgi:eukaryotic-like serine/threonine-protein kinase
VGAAGAVKKGMVVGSAKLQRPLEEGGMGAVWVGEHTETRVPVAVKFMLDELAKAEPTARERFDREARVLAMIQHDHVVRLYEQGELDDGTPYIVMELLSGESLVERLERTEHAFTLDQVSDLVGQTCDALDHLHGRGIVHRDLKGENTFLIGTNDGTVLVKIIDFGLATTPDSTSFAKQQGGAPSWGRKLTKPGEALGSPEYMSPEQIMSSGDVDEQADLWAVAVLAYVSLTLRFPFQSERLPELLAAIMGAKYPPPSSLVGGLPPLVDEWFLQAFNLKKDARFHSAREMAAAWRKATENVRRPAVSARSLVIPAPARRKTRWPFIAGAVAVLVAVVGALAFTFLR